MRAANLKAYLGVYLVTDERKNIESLLHTVECALQGGATAVQLRRKHEDGRLLVQIGQAIRQITRQYHALYLVNDRVDVALLTEADGVHVGQSDISCQDARHLLGDKIIGVSVTTVQEAEQALQDGADYLGVGSLFSTESKDNASVTGLAPLQCIRGAIRDLPIVGIGGINPANAKKVLEAGADGLAVISAIMQSQDPAQTSRFFKELL